MANFARRVVDAGADGLVLFNRFYQPDVDLEALDVVPRLELSSTWELRLPLRWIAILRPLLAGTSLAATSGITSGIDAAKAIAVGADVTMMTSAVLRSGPTAITAAVAGLQGWLDEHEYDSVAQLRGSMSHANTADPSAFERANYRKVLHSWNAPHHLTPSSPSS
jgi:dihydroorotate dehydrogenase (fumarate)